MTYLNIDRKLFLLLFLLIFLTRQAISKTTDNVIIEGYVANFNKLDKSVYLDKSISVEFYAPLGESKRKTANFDKQGKFKLSLHLLYPQDVIIQSGTGYYITTLVMPNESVNMVLSYYKADQATQGYPNIHPH